MPFYLGLEIGIQCLVHYVSEGLGFDQPLPSSQVVENGPNAEDVRLLIVGHAFKHFWSYVPRGAAPSMMGLRGLLFLYSKPKVCKGYLIIKHVSLLETSPTIVIGLPSLP
jgi:hypothetical protein